VFHNIDIVIALLLEESPSESVTPDDVLTAVHAAPAYLLAVSSNGSLLLRTVDPVSWVCNLQSTSPLLDRHTTAIINTPPANIFRSLPPSPPKLFTDSQRKKLKKNWTLDEYEIEFAQHILNKAGVKKDTSVFVHDTQRLRCLMQL